MKQTLCILAAGAALLTGLTGCSADEELSNVAQSASNEIRFNVVTTNPQTKAVIIDGTGDLQQYPFRVYAYKGGESFMNDVKIAYNSGVWNYVDPNDQAYWPHNATLDFYAVCFGIYDEALHEYPTITKDKQSFGVHIEDEFDNGSQPNMDVMYALAKNQSKMDNNGVVPLKFKHALCQVKFKAIKSERTRLINVEVKGMKLCSVSSSEMFTLPQLGEEKGSWTDNNTLSTNYRIKLDNNDPITVQNSLDIATNLSTLQPLLCIPQSLTAWVPESGSTIINTGDHPETGDGSSFLEIECKIWKDGHYFVGDVDRYGYTYVPFSAQWEEGKRYTYTLHFGGGYNPDGTEIDIVPITFTAEATDWVDAPNDITGF